ncbi:MAG: hypothetical protein QM775_11400 [Pirellulales bacterium]
MTAELVNAELMNMELFIRIGGVLQLGVLTAAGLVPTVLDWRSQLASADRLVRQLMWVYAGYVVLMIGSLGLLSLLQADALVSGTPLARIITGFDCVFWTIRLGLQLFVFDAEPYLSSRFLRLGHHGLTVVFTYLSIVFTWATFA